MLLRVRDQGINVGSTFREGWGLVGLLAAFGLQRQSAFERLCTLRIINNNNTTWPKIGTERVVIPAVAATSGLTFLSLSLCVARP